MSNNTIDKRTIRTKKAIISAYANLLTEKDISEINVIDIAKEAKISRKTFYYYYKGIWQLTEEVEQEIVESLVPNLETLNLKDAIHDPSILFNSISSAIEGNLEFFSKVFQSDFKSRIWRSILQTLKKRVKKNFINQVTISSSQLDMTIDFYAAGLLEAFRIWIRLDDEEEKAKLSQLVGLMIFNGISSYIK